MVQEKLESLWDDCGHKMEIADVSCETIHVSASVDLFDRSPLNTGFYLGIRKADTQIALFAEKM